MVWYFFFFQAEDGIRDLVRSRGLGDVYKRQERESTSAWKSAQSDTDKSAVLIDDGLHKVSHINGCLLYTSDAADERSSVDLGGRRIIKQKNKDTLEGDGRVTQTSGSTYN